VGEKGGMGVGKGGGAGEGLAASILINCIELPLLLLPLQN